MIFLVEILSNVAASQFYTGSVLHFSHCLGICPTSQALVTFCERSSSSVRHPYEGSVGNLNTLFTMLTKCRFRVMIYLVIGWYKGLSLNWVRGLLKAILMKLSNDIVCDMRTEN